MSRRLEYCSKQLHVGRLSGATCVEFFASYSIKNVMKMYTCIQDIQDGFATSLLNVSVPHLMVLRLLLLHIIENRVRPHAATLRPERKLFVLPYLKPFFDLLPSSSVFLDSWVEGLLPSAVPKQHPVIAYAYPLPLGLSWCNHNKLAKWTQPDKKLRIVQGTCLCAHPVFQSFVPSGHQHVITCKAAILTSVGQYLHTESRLVAGQIPHQQTSPSLGCGQKYG